MEVSGIDVSTPASCTGVTTGESPTQALKARHTVAPEALSQSHDLISDEYHDLEREPRLEIERIVIGLG